MDGPTPFVGEPADTREAIMRGTYDVLLEHGYAGLSIGRIADAADVSKSTVYHHFEDKADLLAAFVEFTLAEFTAMLRSTSGNDPAERLRTFLEFFVAPSPDVDRELPEDLSRMLGVYVELRAQGVRSDHFARTFAETDRAFQARLESIIRAGVEDGTFHDVDPDATATLLLTLVGGHLFRRSTRNDAIAGDVRPVIERFVDDHLAPAGTSLWE